MGRPTLPPCVMSSSGVKAPAVAAHQHSTCVWISCRALEKKALAGEKVDMDIASIVWEEGARIFEDKDTLQCSVPDHPVDRAITRQREPSGFIRQVCQAASQQLLLRCVLVSTSSARALS